MEASCGHHVGTFGCEKEPEEHLEVKKVNVIV